MAGKSVLVIDTPKDCGDCPCIHDELWMCQTDKEHREANYSGRPSWCPLKPLPEWKDVPEYLGTNRDWEAWGYDQCLAEILGDAKGENE